MAMGELSFPPLAIKGVYMSIISILVFLIIIGVLLWVVNSVIPMDGRIKTIFNVVALIAVILWLLRAFGLLDGVRL